MKPRRYSEEYVDYLVESLDGTGGELSDACADDQADGLLDGAGRGFVGAYVAGLADTYFAAGGLWYLR